jgi:hypothetical protein
MNTLWKFESYEIERLSFFPVWEATGPDSFKLLSSRQMNLLISEVKVMGEEAGNRKGFFPNEGSRFQRDRLVRPLFIS